MREVTHTTTTGKADKPETYREWTVSYGEPETLAEFVEFYSGEDNLLGALRAALKQAVTQNNKTAVADALKAHAANPNEETAKAVEDAIAAHQKTAKEYRPGQVRAKTDETGLTAKQHQAFSKGVATFAISNGGRLPNAKEMAQIAADLGIDFSKLGQG